MSEVAVAAMTEQDARRLTERIRLSLDTASKSLDRLASLVAEAYQDRADLALGYASWAAYSEAEFSEQTRDLAAPIRRELVGYLSASGMGTRAIAPVVRASHMTVSRDRANGLDSGVTPRYTSLNPEPDPATYSQAMDTETGEILEPAQPPKVTGLDGKTYTRPASKPTPTEDRKLSDDVAIINDIRLYLGHIATSPEIARLSPAGKQHIIDALSSTIAQLKEN